jgi:tetratricopeptide (TPR) repeat protein
MKRARSAVILLFAGCVATPDGPRSSSLLPKADELFLAEQYAQAAGHYEAYLSENPEDPRRDEVRLRLAKCRLGAGQPGPAVQEIERALRGLSPAPRLEAVFRRGVARRQLGDATAALQDFAAVDAADPQILDAAGLTVDEVHYERALARFRAGDWTQGQADLARVSPRGPFGARARTRLGLGAYAVQVGAFESEAPARSLVLRTPGASLRSVPGEPPLHVVAVGRYSRPEEAQRELERLRVSGHPEAFIVP